jgi:hypothetical protein
VSVLGYTTATGGKIILKNSNANNLINQFQGYASNCYYGAWTLGVNGDTISWEKSNFQLTQWRVHYAKGTSTTTNN